MINKDTPKRCTSCKAHGHLRRTCKRKKEKERKKKGEDGNSGREVEEIKAGKVPWYIIEETPYEHYDNMTRIVEEEEKNTELESETLLEGFKRSYNRASPPEGSINVTSCRNPCRNIERRLGKALIKNDHRKMGEINIYIDIDTKDYPEERLERLILQKMEIQQINIGSYKYTDNSLCVRLQTYKRWGNEQYEILRILEEYGIKDMIDWQEEEGIKMTTLDGNEIDFNKFR